LGDQDSDSIIDLTDADVKASGPGLEKELTVNVPTSFCVDVSEAGKNRAVNLSSLLLLNDFDLTSRTMCALFVHV